MNYAIIGYGRMGRAIEREASRRAHRQMWVRGRPATGMPRTMPSRADGGPEVVFEFTSGEAAEENVCQALDAGIAVVCGTTGWARSPALDAAIAGSSAGAIIAPNYSVGMALFCRLVGEAARLFASTGLHDPWIHERHHRAKRDSPSGTACRLAEIVGVAQAEYRGASSGRRAELPAARTISVSSSRAGAESGYHEIGWDGEHDVIELHHRSRGRSGFALGAVLAAEWLVGRRGLHGFDEVVTAILAREFPLPDGGEIE